MAKFTDDDFQDWKLDLDFNTANRFRKQLELDIFDPDQLRRLFTDIIFRVDVLYVAIMPEAEAKGVSSEDFGKRIVGTIENATMALLAALKSFFQKTGHVTLAALVGKAIESVKEVTKVNQRTAEKIDRAPISNAVKRRVADLEQRIDAEIAELLTIGETSIASPESAVLATSDTSPTAS